MQSRIIEMVALIDIEIEVLRKGMNMYIERMPEKLDNINHYQRKINDLTDVRRHYKLLKFKYENATIISS